MDDLIAFLKARLDEDEQTARMGAQLHDDEPADPSYAGGVADLESAGWEPEAARRFNAYVARFDPARVLREVDAKRKIITKYEIAVLSVRAAKGTSLTGAAKIILSAYENVLRILAEPGADHPDYLQEWKP